MATTTLGVVFSNDTRGVVIERFTDRNNLCILNDGSPTYLKPQAQHSQNPISAIDLSICTPGLALRCTWEVLSDTHGSDHYPVLISVPPSSGDTDQGSDPSHWVFSKADWEQFAELCMDKIRWHPAWPRPPHIICCSRHWCCKRQHPKGDHNP